jgi:hypothetical protein
MDALRAAGYPCCMDYLPDPRKQATEERRLTLDRISTYLNALACCSHGTVGEERRVGGLVSDAWQNIYHAMKAMDQMVARG